MEGNNMKRKKARLKKTISKYWYKYKFIIFTVFIVLFIGLLIQYILFEIKHTKRLSMVISNMTEIKDGFNWDHIGIQERKSKYRKMMIRIMTVYGFQYDKKFKKAMSTEQKIEYINLNFDAATKLNMNLFDVPTIHLIETAFNPYAEGGYSERGLGQIKFNTAMLAERLLKIMPAYLRKLLHFEIKNKEDLFDPILNTKATYVLLWYLRKDYKGREDWYISAYHWGGFLRKHWDNGNGEVPLSFTLNGIKYSVIKYYITFSQLKESFVIGKLEAGKAIEEKWAKYRQKLVKEEIDFRKTKRIIRSLREKLAEKKALEQKLDKKHEEIDLALNHADTQLKQISDGSKKDGIKSLKKIKYVVKNLIKKIKSL